MDYDVLNPTWDGIGSGSGLNPKKNYDLGSFRGEWWIKEGLCRKELYSHEWPHIMGSDITNEIVRDDDLWTQVNNRTIGDGV